MLEVISLDTGVAAMAQSRHLSELFSDALVSLRSGLFVCLAFYNEAQLKAGLEVSGSIVSLCSLYT